jgi:hypothetical protein
VVPISISKKINTTKETQETNQKLKGEKKKCGIFLRLVTTMDGIKSIKIA